jgi:hypothetical protein
MRYTPNASGKGTLEPLVVRLSDSVTIIYADCRDVLRLVVHSLSSGVRVGSPVINRAGMTVRFRPLTWWCETGSCGFKSRPAHYQPNTGADQSREPKANEG